MLGPIILIFTLCLSGTIAHASTIGEEEIFLNSRLHLVDQYAVFDQEEVSEFQKSCGYALYLNDSIKVGRQIELYLASQVAVSTLLTAEFVMNSATIAKAMSESPLLVRFSKLFTTNVGRRTISHTGFFNQDEKTDLADILNTSKNILSEQAKTLWMYANPLETDTDRLHTHQLAFQNYLETRQKLDAAFEAKKEAILAMALNLVGALNYGNKQAEFVELETLQGAVFSVLNETESNYLIGALDDLVGTSVQSPSLRYFPGNVSDR